MLINHLSGLMVKGLLVHVVIDSSNLGVVGPLFCDSRFEYIPLNNTYGIERRTYSKFPARNREFGNNLSDFLPPKCRELAVHYDPNFENFTYGQHGGVYPRIKSLEKLRKGDFLFFIASLAPYDAEVYTQDIFSLKSYQVGKKNKYVIGFFEVDGVAEVFAFKSSPRLTLALFCIWSFQESGEVPLEMRDMKQELNILEEYGYICKEQKGYRLTGDADNKLRRGEDLVVAIDEMWPEEENARKRFLEDGFIDINVISGEVSEEKVKKNHHYKRLRPLDIDWFSLITGDPENSILLDKAIPLTENFKNGSFSLNDVGRKIRGRNTDTLRGIRWLYEDGVTILLDEILKMNPLKTTVKR